MKRPTFNTMHALTHPKAHCRLNEGWVGALLAMFTKRQFSRELFSWCPMCTLASLYLWLVLNRVSYK